MEQRISKGEIARQWAKRSKEAGDYLENQSLPYQPLVTDCIVDAEGNMIRAKEMFDQRKEEYMKKRNELIGETVSRIRALIREQNLTVFSGFSKEQPNRYHTPDQGPKYSNSLREKRGRDLEWEIRTGTKEEMEHTDDPKEARKIAITHIEEDPKYYRKMKRVGLVKDQAKPEVEPAEPETIPDIPTKPDVPTKKPWSPFDPDIDPSITPDPKARRK